MKFIDKNTVVSIIALVVVPSVSLIIASVEFGPVAPLTVIVLAGLALLFTAYCIIK